MGEPEAPVFIDHICSMHVYDGEPLRLECCVEGNPKPNITWFHESHMILPSTDFMQYYDDDNVASLAIKEVYPDDTGRYTVVAKNMAGVATSMAQLIVQGNMVERKKDHLLGICRNVFIILELFYM